MVKAGQNLAKVRIITDSTCDLPHKLANELNIIIVPLKVKMGDKIFTPGKDISSIEFYEQIPHLKKTPMTIPPSPATFFATYEDATKEAETVFSIHISKLMSETLKSAEQAKSMLPFLDIRIFDSMTTGAALGLIVLIAAKAAKDGRTPEEIESIIKDAIRQVNVVGFPKTLNYLIKGGRIGRARGLIGKLLGRLPILTVKEGETASIATVQGQENALSWILNYLEKEQIDSTTPLAITHGNIPQTANNLKLSLENRFNCTPTYIEFVGPIVSAHLGPGCLYIAYMRKK